MEYIPECSKQVYTLIYKIVHAQIAHFTLPNIVV